MVEWPPAKCDCNPEGYHHYTLQLGVWICKYCHRAKWQPATLTEAVPFSGMVKTRGIDYAYSIAVSKRPVIKDALEKLEELRLMKQAMPEKEFHRAVPAIVMEKRRRKCQK